MIIKTALASAAILCAMAAPGFCATSFDFTGTGGSFTATGSTLSAAGVDFTQLAVGGDPTSGLNGNYTISSESMTLSGIYLILSGDVTGTPAEISAGFTNILSPTTLFEIALSNTTTQTSASPATIDFNTTVGAVSYGSTLLHDLLGSSNFAGSCASTSCAIDGSGSGPTYAAFSNTVDTTLFATPEPVSFVLMGGGLLFVGGLARRRRKA